MLSDYYNIAIQIYSFRVVYFVLEVKLQSEQQYEFFLLIIMKFGYKMVGYLMEASVLRGLMTLKEDKPNVIEEDMDIYEQESVRTVTENFIARFGI